MTLEERAKALLVRLEREIARVEAGTVAVGGLTKAGNDLEALLKTAASACCRSQGTSLDAEVRRRGVKAGAGTYARVLADASGAAVQHPIAQSLARDVRAGKTSRVLALIDLRNENAHGSLPDPKVSKSRMSAVVAMLRPLVPA